MFLAYNRVRMHDTDMAGILYFPRQFRFAHDALEDFFETCGFTFDQLFKQEKFVFVIVHAESDYYVPLHVGDKLEVQVSVGAIGTTSFAIHYKIFKKDQTLAGFVKTVHVSLESSSRTKMPIPPHIIEFLQKHLENS